MMRRLFAALVLVFTAGLLAAPHASASPGGQLATVPIKTLGECYEAPTPYEPTTGLEWMPSDGESWPNDNAHSPFRHPDQYPPQLVYGWNVQTVIYDNGCGPVGAIMPGIGNSIANTLEGIVSITESWAYAAMHAAIDPSWLGALDTATTTATRAVAASTWTKWLTISILLVSCVVLIRARSGQLAGSVTATLWMMAVLTAVSAVVSYPTDAPKLVDSAVQGATVTIAESFSDNPATDAQNPNPPEAGGKNAAVTAVDRLWGGVWMNTLYKQWASETFGNADSPTAKKYGPWIYDLTHFTASEWKQYQQDPNGKGRAIGEAKKKRFDHVAQTLIKKEDPIAYDYLTGNRWAHRMQTATIFSSIAMGVVLFLAAAAVMLLVSFLITRLISPFSPALGLAFLLDAFRDTLTGALKKGAMVIVAGPVQLIGALVVMRVDGAIWRSDIPALVQFGLIITVTFIAWKLLKPMQFVPKPNIGGVAHQAGAYMLGRLRQKAKDDEKVEDKGNSDTGSSTDTRTDLVPVAGGEDTRRQRFTETPRGSRADVDPGHDDDLPEYQATPWRQSSRGTFVPREGIGAPRSSRATRWLSSAPQAADGDQLVPTRRPILIDPPRGEDTAQNDDTSGTLPAPGEVDETPTSSTDGVRPAPGEVDETPTSSTRRRTSAPSTFAPRRSEAAGNPFVSGGTVGGARPAQHDDKQRPRNPFVNIARTTAYATDETSGAPKPAPNPFAGEGAGSDDRSGTRRVDPTNGDRDAAATRSTAAVPAAAATETTSDQDAGSTGAAADGGTVRLGRRPRSGDDPIEPAAVYVPVSQRTAGSHEGGSLDDVNEANLVYDADGNPEFVVYHPDRSTHYGVE